MSAIDNLFARIKDFPDELIEKLHRIADEMVPESTRASIPSCVRCGGNHVYRNGHKCGKQAYLCRDCRKSFVETTNTLMYHSHFGKEVWDKVTEDTLACKPIDKTAAELGIEHHTVFNMRHKILKALEDSDEECPIELGEVTELDETFVLESYKGSKADLKNAGRKSRKHGAKATKPGISSEYVCICAGVERKGEAYAHTVNRAKPSKSELQSVFNGHISEGTLALCDGLKAYKYLEALSGCTVSDVNTAQSNEKNFYNLNTINNFHSFIKQQYRAFRGVATKYLNRYNALLATSYRNSGKRGKKMVQRVCLCSSKSHFHSNADVTHDKLLSLPLNYACLT